MRVSLSTALYGFPLHRVSSTSFPGQCRLSTQTERQREELGRLLTQANFLLVPTRAEAYGLVFCEACAFGLPVVATDTGGVPQIVRDGENGFLLPYEAGGDAYAEAIARAYRDKERYVELVQASRVAFEERLNWDTWGSTVKHILCSVLGRKDRRFCSVHVSLQEQKPSDAEKCVQVQASIIEARELLTCSLLHFQVCSVERNRTFTHGNRFIGHL